MKILVQHGRANPRDWEELDSAEWADLPKKPIHSGGPRDDSPGHVHAINIQGNISSGYDHYAVEHLGDAVRMTMWSDESKPEGEKFAIAWTFLPLAPDPRFGGAYNTRHSQTVFAQADVKARYESLGPIENTQVVGWEWFVPPPDAVVRHDPQLPVSESDRHHGKLSHRGWMEWTEGVPAEHLDERGHLKEQRERGLYMPLGGTKTYYQRNVAQAAGAVAATNEEQMTTGTAASATLGSGNYAGGSSHLAFLFTSPASEPNNAAWPTGNYRAQLNCTAAGSGITYGMRTTGSVAGYIGRYSSDLATALETKTQTEAVFSSPGLKLGTTGSVSWSSGAAGDRYAVLVGGTRSASGGNQTFTLTLNTTDSFADGPWTNVYNESVTAAASADLTDSAVLSMSPVATAAGSADSTVGAVNQMPASESLAATAGAEVGGGLLFSKSADMAGAADAESSATQVVPATAEVAGSADVANSARMDFVAAAALAAVADVLAAGATSISAALTVAGAPDAAASATIEISVSLAAGGAADAQASGQMTMSVTATLPASAELTPMGMMILLAAAAAAAAAELQAEGIVSGGGGNTYNESLDVAADAQLSPTATITFLLTALLDGAAETVASVSVRIAVSTQVETSADAESSAQLDAAAASELAAGAGAEVGSLLDAVGGVQIAGGATASVSGSLAILAEVSAETAAQLAASGGFSYDEVLDLIAAGEIVLTAEGRAFRARQLFGESGDARKFRRDEDGRIFGREGDDREFGE